MSSKKSPLIGRHAAEVSAGQRFEFGKNWSRFLSVLNEERIAAAEKSLKDMLEVDDLHGKTFLDIGSGSGLFSLTAMRLGASKVHSIDYDPKSVACAKELKRRYFPDSDNWIIEEGSVLDEAYLSSLGEWDILYSWGVLHHTGNMWKALENVAPLVKKGGKLFIAIYNWQPLMTPVWTRIKKTYVKGNSVIKAGMLIPFIATYITWAFFYDLLRRQSPLRRYREKKKRRGMSYFYDWIDWLGGYPYETARPEEIFDFYRQRGFVMERLITQFGNAGINEFVFSKR